MSDLFANPNQQATLLAIVAGAWPPGRPHRVVHGVSFALVRLPAAIDEPRGPLRVFTGEIAARLVPMRAILAHSPVNYPFAVWPC